MHEREDEYSFVLEGRVGVQVGEEVRVAAPGYLVFKPRSIWHAFWNAGDEPARVLEIAELQARYGLTMDVGSVERLVTEHSLVAQG